MQVIYIKRSVSIDQVNIGYVDGNIGCIMSSVGYAADMTTAQLVAEFENPDYETNGFISPDYTAATIALSEGVTDWVTEYSV